MPLTALESRAKCLTHFGEMLRSYRRGLGVSQMDLALGAGVSAKHLSFLETNRAQPSRDMVQRLADALKLGIADTEILLASAGYLPRSLAISRQMEVLGSRQVIDLLLDRHEPYPAVALDECWNVIQSNPAAKRFRKAMANTSNEMNLAKLCLAPDGYRPRIRDWERVAVEIMVQINADVKRYPANAALRQLFDRCRNYPGVNALWTLASDRQLHQFGSATYNTIIGDLRLYWAVLQVCFPTSKALESVRLEFSFPADTETAFACETKLASL